MIIIDILTEKLKGKTLRADVEAYNSIVCMTHYPKDELVLIDRVDVTSIEGDIQISGYIIGGKNDGQSCNIFIGLETDINLID